MSGPTEAPGTQPTLVKGSATEKLTLRTAAGESTSTAPSTTTAFSTTIRATVIEHGSSPAETRSFSAAAHGASGSLQTTTRTSGVLADKAPTPAPTPQFPPEPLRITHASSARTTEIAANPK